MQTLQVHGDRIHDYIYAKNFCRGRCILSRKSVLVGAAVFILLSLCVREAFSSDAVEAMQRKRHGKTGDRQSAFAALNPKVSCYGACMMFR